MVLYKYKISLCFLLFFPISLFPLCQWWIPNDFEHQTTFQQTTNLAKYILQWLNVTTMWMFSHILYPKPKTNLNWLLYFFIYPFALLWAFILIKFVHSILFFTCFKMSFLISCIFAMLNNPWLDVPLPRMDFTTKH